MRALNLFAAGFALAAALFVSTMLVSPPQSEARSAGSGGTAGNTPLELVGP